MLRAVALLSSTVLFLPFLSVLLQAFQCISGEWAVHSLPCYRGGHIPILAASSILLPCFILLSVFMSAIFFDRDIRSKIASDQTNGESKLGLMCFSPNAYLYVSQWFRSRRCAYVGQQNCFVNNVWTLFGIIGSLAPSILSIM